MPCAVEVMRQPPCGPLPLSQPSDRESPLGGYLVSEHVVPVLYQNFRLIVPASVRNKVLRSYSGHIPGG